MSGNLGGADFAANPRLAVGPIATCLQDGVLTLLLGAGVSTGFGLPNWFELVMRLAGIQHGSPAYLEYLARYEGNALPDQELQELVDRVDDGSTTYLDKVRQALYAQMQPDLARQLSTSPLLLAVAALTTGTTRGRVDVVTTYNFDDVLEHYVQMLGHSVRIRTNESDLVGRADVTINHPHGFVPRDISRSHSTTQPILSAKAYREKRAQIDAGWSDYIAHVLTQKVALFVGLSGRDSSILDLLHRISKRWKADGRRPGGYWILTPSDYDKYGPQIAEENVIPLRFEIDEIPMFIFDVCRRAVEGTAYRS